MDALSSTLRESVDEGVHRLHRSLSSLLATGAVGGIDVSVGVFGLLLVKAHSDSDLLAALAFSIGFIALTLANSELFTENFLVPVTAVAAGKAGWTSVLRLWGGTVAMNLLGGLVMVAIMITAFPDLRPAAAEIGQHFVDSGAGSGPFLDAVLAGIIITLMTWMQMGSSMGGQMVAAVAAAFLLAFGEMHHVIVASLEMFAGMVAGAPYGAGEWFPLFLMMMVGNAVGGIGLVTLLRLVQVGRGRLEGEKRRHVPDEASEEGDEEEGSPLSTLRPQG